MRKRSPSGRRVLLNVGGVIYETYKQTLRRYPNTLLGNDEKLQLHYCENTEQYFFNRSRVFFDAILFFYQSGGVLRCPYGVPYDLFEDECRYYQLPEDAIGQIKPLELRKLLKDLEDDDDGEHPHFGIRSKMWDILQNPETSVGARIFSLFSLFMIALSVISSCIESLPELQVEMGTPWERNPWAINELVLNIWFLIELIVRILCAPNLYKFFTDTMTAVDCIAIIPYFMILTLSRKSLQSFAFLRIVRLVRIIRMMRLSKHSHRLKIVGRILLSCAGDIKTLLICVVMIIILTGSLMYYLEDKGRNGSHFTSIPSGMYWSVQTFTTVGYGDIIPFSDNGMFLAALIMLFGALTVSVPLLSIVRKFLVEDNLRRSKEF